MSFFINISFYFFLSISFLLCWLTTTTPNNSAIHSLLPDSIDDDEQRSAVSRGVCDVHVSAQLALGGTSTAGAPVRTASQPLPPDRSDVIFRELLALPLKTAAVPRGARLVLALWAVARDASAASGAPFPLGAVAVPCDTSDGYLAQGVRQVPLWCNCR